MQNKQTTGKSSSFNTKDIMVARQAVFNRDKSVWGYELLYRSPKPPDPNQPFNGSKATATVITDGMSLVQPHLKGDQKMLINFPQSLISKGMGDILNKKNCVIEILEDTQPTDEVLKEIGRLKDDGYTLALDDYEDQSHLKPFIPLVDIIKFEIPAIPVDKFSLIVEKYGADKLLLAEKIEDQKVFDACHKSGFDLFQGFFFRKPEIIKGKTLSLSQITEMQLLAKLDDPDFEIREVGEILRNDISISYKLLRYISSAAFSLRQKVESVDRAITILGPRRLLHWLSAIVIGEMGGDSGISAFIAETAVLRAKFLSLIAEYSGHKAIANSCFTLGLFSMLESLLGIPYEEIFKNVSLKQEVIDALMFKESLLTDWRRLLDYYEEANWDDSEALVTKIGATKETVKQAYNDSIVWTGEVLG